MTMTAGIAVVIIENMVISFRLNAVFPGITLMIVEDNALLPTLVEAASVFGSLSPERTGC